MLRYLEETLINFYKSILITLFLISLVNFSFANNYIWNGKISTAWEIPANWTFTHPGIFPGPGDNVTIPSGLLKYPVLNASRTITNFTMSGGSATINSTFTLTVTGTTNISGGIIAGAGGLTITGTNTTISAGTISLTGQLNIGSTGTPVSTVIIGASTISGPTISSYTYINCNNLQLQGTNFTGASATVTIKVNNSAANTTIGGNTFAGITTIEAAGTALLGLSGTAASNYNNSTTFLNSSSGGLYTAYSFADTYNSTGTVFFTNTGTGGVYPSRTGLNTIIKNIVLKCTNWNGTNNGIVFGANSGTTTLADTKTITVSNSGADFTAGILELKNFTQFGSTSQTITLTGTTSLLKFESGSEFNSDDLIANSPRVEINACTFKGVSNKITKTGANEDVSTGGFSFTNASTSPLAITEIKNSGTGAFKLGGGTFSSIVKMINNGTGGLYPANIGSTTFNGDIQLQSSSNPGIYFGNDPTSPGSSSLISGKTITASGSSMVSLKYFTQNGTSTSQNLSSMICAIGTGCEFYGPLTASSLVLTINGSIFHNTVSASGAPISNVLGSTFKGTTTLSHSSTSSGSSSTWSGGNTFEAATSISFGGAPSSSLTLANVNPDVFLQDVNFSNSTSGTIFPGNNGENIFKGNITSSGLVTIGNGNGVAKLDGTSDQSINGSGTLIIRRLTSAKSSSNITVNRPFTISNNLTFNTAVNCKINNGSNLITILDDATVTDAGSTAFINGIVEKKGNDSFSFPIGKGTKFMPIAMSAPSNATHSYTAEAFLGVPPNNGSVDAAIKISNCQYWNFQNLGGSPLNNELTLLWDASSCTPIAAASVKVALYDGFKWVSAGANNLIGNNSSGSITSNPLPSYGYITFAEDKVEMISYAPLSKKTNAGYYTTSAGKLYFTYFEEYVSSGALNYKLYDYQNNVKVSSGIYALTKGYGDNKFTLDLTTYGLTNNAYYILEVIDEKNVKYFLKIKYIN